MRNKSVANLLGLYKKKHDITPHLSKLAIWKNDKGFQNKWQKALDMANDPQV